MENAELLAQALGTTLETIALPEGVINLDSYVDVELKIEGQLTNTDQPKDILAILEQTQKLIGAKYRLLLMYVGEGSIIVKLKMHIEDVMRLGAVFEENWPIPDIISINYKARRSLMRRVQPSSPFFQRRTHKRPN